MAVDHLTLRLVGGPTAVFEYAGLRWLTDPTFSPPGEYGGLVKTTGPALGFDELGPIDVVLLSHDHHADNLDPEGRALLPRAGRVLTTTAGAERLGRNAIGLAPWSSLELDRPDGGTGTATAVPALHGSVVGMTQTLRPLDRALWAFRAAAGHAEAGPTRRSPGPAAAAAAVRDGSLPFARGLVART